MQEYKPFKEGKVREVYDNGDSLIMVATDRISVYEKYIIIFFGCSGYISSNGATTTRMAEPICCRTEQTGPSYLCVALSNRI